MKIRMLIDKITADFLTPTKAQSEIELSRIPMTITYDQSLVLFRNMVNQKHPPQVGAVNHWTRRQVNEITSAGDAVAVVVVAEADDTDVVTVVVIHDKHVPTAV
jgi:hypothetical protein